MFRREDVLEAVGVLRQEYVRLFRNVSGMIVQYDSNGALRRILRIEVGQQSNEFDAAVAVFHARRDVTVLEIQCCQYGAGAESLVFVIATDCGMLAWDGRQVRRGIADGLDSRLLVHRNSNDIGHRLAGGPSGIL